MQGERLYKRQKASQERDTELYPQELEQVLAVIRELQESEKATHAKLNELDRSVKQIVEETRMLKSRHRFLYGGARGPFISRNGVACTGAW